jgi:hypothetical protein
MKIAYYIFLFLTLAYVFIIVTDGCEQQRRIDWGSPRPEDTYLSVHEANDILYAVVFGILALVFRILWGKQKSTKHKLENTQEPPKSDNP